MENIPYTLLIGFIVSIAWFIAGGILYMNPLVAKLYKKFEDHPGMKKWDNQKKYLTYMYLLGALIPCLIFAFIYESLSPIGIVHFGLIFLGIRIIPRFVDMWMQSSYPTKILGIEIVNGTILSFMAAALFSVLRGVFMGT
jgi:hypothetical protein